MEEIDIWRTATVVIKQHGQGAGMVAARRADQLRRDGDKVGAAMWVKIWRAIKALQSEKPREGEAVN